LSGKQPMLITLEAVYQDTVQARMRGLPVYNPLLPASLELSRLELGR
jgi:hypothetical protein